MSFKQSDDGTTLFTNPDWTLGQSKFQRVDNGAAKMNVDGRATGTPVVLWNGTGGGDTGSDWTVDAGIGSEQAAAMHSGTNGWDTGVAALNQDTRFSNGADIDVNGLYTELTFWMQPKAFPIGAKLRVQFQNMANDVIGANLNVENYVTNMDLDVWQKVSIPIADFNLTANVAKMRFRYRQAAGQHFWFDDIELVPPGGGPYKFRVEAPTTERWHVSMLVLVISGPSAGWDASAFASIAGGLPNGLLLRGRDKALGETLWSLNSKNNVDLFGRFHPQDDITFADGDLLLGFMIKPGKASIVVTDNLVLDFLVRDDLSSLSEMRAYLHYGVEKVEA
jgi:hypothetical protein